MAQRHLNYSDDVDSVLAADDSSEDVVYSASSLGKKNNWQEKSAVTVDPRSLKNSRTTIMPKFLTNVAFYFVVFGFLLSAQMINVFRSGVVMTLWTFIIPIIIAVVAAVFIAVIRHEKSHTMGWSLVTLFAVFYLAFTLLTVIS